jgi:hypothetical protein
MSIAGLLDIEPAWSGLVDAPTTAAPDVSTEAVAEPRVSIRVVWGDLVSESADIHVAGHYQGVLPAGSEAALDQAISATPDRGIISEHTRRRWLVGSLGEVAYFPGHEDASDSRIHRVAVAGMGRLGTFGDNSAEQLFTSLLKEISSLPHVQKMAMAMIGTGAANLSMGRGARALATGFATALRSPAPASWLTEIAVVEIDRLRAEQLLVALRGRESAGLRVHPRIKHGQGGQVGTDSAAVFAVRALAQAIRREQGSPNDRRRRSTISRQFAASLPEHLRDLVPAQLQDITDDIEGLDIRVLPAGGGPKGDRAVTDAPTRISVGHQGAMMRWAALTERATIPEREVPVKPELVGDLVKRLTAPSAEDGERLPRMLRRWVVPEDFQPHVDARAPIVLDVNGNAARLPWEFLTDERFDNGEETWPLALRTPIARQLRTSYAKATAEREETAGLRALVIADPGPASMSLPEARQEGLDVARLLSQRGADVTVFMGSPENPPPAPLRAATELDVLNELLVGHYELVHFAGHGLFDAADPECAGWLFADGVLAARELSQLTQAPRVVVANACWSAALASTTTAAGDLVDRARLTPVLAEEFLRVGVTHYIGTSWRIPDTMAKDFAHSFYDRALPQADAPGRPLGQAIREARQFLYAARPTDTTTAAPEALCAWAAYQHYGDPADVMHPFQSARRPAALPESVNG